MTPPPGQLSRSANQPGPTTTRRRLLFCLRGSRLFKRSVASAGFLLVAALGPARLSAGEVKFSAGAGEADITPDPKMINYYTTHKPYGVVHDPLSVRAL